MSETLSAGRSCPFAAVECPAAYDLKSGRGTPLRPALQQLQSDLEPLPFQGSERRESAMSQSQRSPFVRGFEQLFELTPAELDYLQRLERAPHHVPARRMLIEEGRKYDRALIVQTGWLIEYVLLRDGKRQILNFRLPGEIVGVDGLAYALMPHSVATLAPGVVADLPLASFEALQCEFPRLASALFLMHSERGGHPAPVGGQAWPSRCLRPCRASAHGAAQASSFAWSDRRWSLPVPGDAGGHRGLRRPHHAQCQPHPAEDAHGGPYPDGRAQPGTRRSGGLAKAGGFKPGYLLNWSARLARAQA